MRCEHMQMIFFIFPFSVETLLLLSHFLLNIEFIVFSFNFELKNLNLY
jgi:hypothetical protein